MSAEITETLSPVQAEALAGLLGVAPPDEGEPLPFGWHWVYLLDRPRQEELGPDGHPVAGLVPPEVIAGKRRMWAGGQIDRIGDLRLGEPAVRRSELVRVEHKDGRSGPLVVAQVAHRILQRGELVLEERQDLVYREPAAGAAPGAGAGDVVAADPALGERELGIDPTVLFRFSALTYNAHRIHYDRDYAVGVEGYPDLVTHGPLQAIAMAEAARARYGATGRRMSYRLVAPLFETQGLIAGASSGAEGIELSVRDRSGRRTALGVVST